MLIKRLYYYVFCLVCVALFSVPQSLRAAGANTLSYSKEHPLVFEAGGLLWPYSFLNEHGQPDGFSIDLIRLMLNELNIPFEIRMRSRQEAMADMKSGKADLMMGLGAGFADDQVKFSRSAVILFTQSVVAPKSHPTDIRMFRDLSDHQVRVYRNSLCHHLMEDYGWGENAIVCDDINEAILELSRTEEGCIVWNTISLEWLLRKFQIDNLVITPVDMPHGEYKFMSNNETLLEKLDSIYVRLSTDDKLRDIQNKWFYPERNLAETPAWVKYAVAGLLLLAMLMTYFFINYRVQLRRRNEQLKQRNRQLSLILETSGVRMWTYDVASHLFTKYNDSGMVSSTYTVEELSRREGPSNFQNLMAALNEVASQQQEMMKLEEKRSDADGVGHNYQTTLSVLRRGAKGKPAVILISERDVTEECRRRRADERQRLRYLSVFDMPMRDILFFNAEGILVDLNSRGCETFCCDYDEVVAERLSIYDLFGTPDLNLQEADGLCTSFFLDLDRIPQEQRRVKCFHRTGRIYYEIVLKTVSDGSGQLLGVFAVGRDITDAVEEARTQRESMVRTEAVTQELTDYIRNINYVLRAGGVRMASYSPDSHVMTIYSGIDEVQLALTQARCMTLVDDKSRKKAMRMLTNMDNRTSNNIDVDVSTVVRVANGHQLHLQFNFVPTTDSNDRVTGYFGLCRDVTELKTTELQLASETMKAQEVESAKNSFLHNMSYEIRTPLSAVVGFAEQFETEHEPADEKVFVKEILKNSDHLLKLINGILFLSRLDARMIEIDKTPSDFALVFDAYCSKGWDRYRRNEVNYIIENPYESLVADVDAMNLGRVIEQLTANAAQHTRTGTVRARYDYIGRMLRIVIDDTGSGIPAEDLTRIFDRFVKGRQEGSGLGLPISKELVEQMGGTLEISSDVGQGTTIWITIPCRASVIVRKKFI